MDEDKGSLGRLCGFPNALILLKQGVVKKAYRKGWNGNDIYIFMVDEWQRVNKPNDRFPGSRFIAMKTANNSVVPWVPSQSDLLADDWCVYFTDEFFDEFFS